MRKYLKYFIVLITPVLLSCSDSYLDINTNPNVPTTSTPEAVLANALNVTAGRLSHHEIGAFWSGQWSPSGSVSGFVPEKSYDIQTNFRTSIFNGTYDNLADYKYIEEQALAQGKMTLAGIARVMKAFNYQILVDAYGNIPYSDALKGTASIRPKYDEAASIYDNIIADIDKGLEYLSEPTSATNPSPVGSDIYFGGNLNKWKKFAKTLKLRMLIRISAVAAKASVVTTGMASLGNTHEEFLADNQNVRSNPGYLKSSNKENQWYETYGYTNADGRSGSHDFYCWSDFFITTVKNLADPRLSLLAYPVGANYIGVPFGEGSDAYLYSKVSGFGPALLPTDATVGSSDLYKRDMVVMTSAESYFLQAEAVHRGLLTSDLTAKELYEKGIWESMQLLSNQSDSKPNMLASYTQYIHNAQPNVDWQSSGDKLRAIAMQKWLALAGHNAFEAWTEYRRTGVPDVPLSTRAMGAKMPVRLLYPNTEYSNNAANAEAEGTINQFDSKIFWDLN